MEESPKEVQTEEGACERNEEEALVEEQIQEEVQINEFQAGSIHEEKFFQFWKDTLKASQWVLDLLQVGYIIPFKTIPGPYMEKNNQVARENMQVVRSIMADMIAKKVVKVVQKKPHCVSPLGLVTKKNGDGKWRLVWDGSRHVNNHLESCKVRLSHLNKALEMTRKGDLQIIFDLTSAYYHVKVHPEQTQFLGAAFEDEQGQVVWVEYQCLPFGLSTAVHAITKVFKPILAHLHEKAIRASIFIDDGRVLADNEEEAERIRIVVYNVIAQAGWAIAKNKSDAKNQAARKKRYLGFDIDTANMQVQVSTEKLKQLESMMDQVLQTQSVNVKVLASLLGKVVSLEPSHAMLTRVSTRAGYELLAMHTEKYGWKGSLVQSPDFKRELTFFKDNMWSGNGACIKNSMTAIRLETILPQPIAMSSWIPNHERSAQMLVSDASQFKAFAYGIADLQGFQLEMKFDQGQEHQSSTARELWALLFSLRHWKVTNQLLQSVVYWITDSRSASICVEKGSRKREVQTLVFEVATICKELKIQIVPIHLRREDPRIEQADEGSKTANTDNWSIDEASFQELQATYNFDYDLFASYDNAKVSNYCSQYYQAAASNLEAWSLDWEKLGMMWVCPPVSELINVAKRITTSRCRGVLCMPLWKTATYYAVYFDSFGNIKEPFVIVKVWHPYITQNEGARNTPLWGHTQFPFAALFFCTL